MFDDYEADVGPMPDEPDAPSYLLENDEEFYNGMPDEAEGNPFFMDEVPGQELMDDQGSMMQQDAKPVVPENVGVSLSDFVPYGDSASEFASREVFDFSSGEVRKVNFCRFPEEVNGELVNFGIPELLVDRDELGEFLAKPGEEYCDFDKEKRLFSFSLCGAEGKFNPDTGSFESLNVNGKEYEEDDLKKIVASQFISMIPQGSLFGKDRDVKKDAAFFKRLGDRDIAVSAFKDKELDDVFNDIKGLTSEFINTAKKFADEQAKINNLQRSLAETGFISRSYEKLFNRLFPEDSRNNLGGTGKVFFSILKPVGVSRREELKSCEKELGVYNESLKSVHEKFKKQHENLNLKIRELPLDVTSKYGPGLRRLAEGLRTISGWEDYRQSDMFNEQSGSAKVLAEYRSRIISNGKFLLADLESCHGNLSGINQMNCSKCYADKIEQVSRIELIGQAKDNPDVLMSPAEAYRSIVKEIMSGKPDLMEKGYSKEDSSVVSRMMVMNYSFEEISAAIKEASPCFVGRESSVDGYVKKFFDRKNDFENEQQYKGKTMLNSRTRNKDSNGKNAESHKKFKKGREQYAGR